MDNEANEASAANVSLTSTGSRNLTPDGYLRANWSNVLEAGEPCQLYITWNAKIGDTYRLLNTTSHPATVNIENSAFYIEAVDQSPAYALEVPAGSMMFGIIAFSEQFGRRQLFASVTQQAGEGPGPGPGGDYLPKANPEYTGTLRGGEAEFAVNPILRGTTATAELSGMALITKDQVFDVLNGTYGVLLEGPGNGILTDAHYGKGFVGRGSITLPYLGASNGFVRVVPATDITVSLEAGHPGTLFADGVNRGPSITASTGVMRTFAQIDGNWYAS